MRENQISIINYNSSDKFDLILKSLKKYGFAAIKNAPIGLELFLRAVEKWRLFFSSEERFKYLFDQIKYEGYFTTDLVEVPINAAAKDFKEFAHFYNNHYPKMVANEQTELFSQFLSVAMEIVNEIDSSIKGKIEKEFSSTIADMISLEKTCLRVNHYPPLTGRRLNNLIRAAPHTDIGLLTCLMATSGDGLQLLDENNKWLSVPSGDNLLIVNVGDLLEVLSRGEYKSIMHRVVLPANAGNLDNSRFSFAFFVHLKPFIHLTKSMTVEDFMRDKAKQFGYRSKEY